MTTTAANFRWWPLIPCGVISVVAAAFVCLHPGSWRDQPWLFSGGGVAMGAAMLAGLYIVRTRQVPRLALYWIMVVSGGLLMLGTHLAPSDDLARYTLEGRQLWVGQNPYSVAPQAPEAQALIDADLRAQVSRPEMTAIYPPLALAYHAAVQGLWRSPYGFTLAALCAAAAIVALTLDLLHRTGRDPALVVVVGWNPVLVLFGVGEAHHDVILGLLVLMALWLALMAKRARSLTWAVISAGCALLVKPFAVVLIPALAPRTGWRRWWWLMPIGIIAYVPFIGAGSGLVASLLTFGGSLHYHGVMDPWLRLGLIHILPAQMIEPVIRGVLGCLLIGGGWWMYRQSVSWSRPAVVAMYAAWLLTCLPTLHPWYFIVLVVVLPFTRSWALPVWTACATIYWLHGIRILEIGTWVETPWVTAAAHLPAVITLAIELTWFRARTWGEPPPAITVAPNNSHA